MPRKKSALPKGFFDRVAKLRQRISAGIQQGFGVVRDLDMTLAQALALFHLGESGPASVSELMAVVGRSQSSTSALVDQLEARGFVVREVSATDGRRRDVCLTEAGRKVVDQVEAARREGLERALEGVPAEVLARYDAALAELLDALPP
ncbi:MAG: MarR family transcriptional regulator [Myxococcales bacterium]|nr:MarR family transcriptional regulator [Myxococcales bacterium]